MDEEEESINVEVGLNKLSIETSGTEEEAVEGLESAQQMEVDEDGEGEGEEGSEGTLMALVVIDFLTQYAEPRQQSFMTVMGSTI